MLSKTLCEYSWFLVKHQEPYSSAFRLGLASVGQLAAAACIGSTCLPHKAQLQSTEAALLVKHK